jgi:H+/Cl- antiporter ClcA
LLALWSPYALTFGEEQLSDLVTPGMALGALAAAAVAKMLAASVCLGTEWKGGFIIPLFFVGAAVGQAFHLLLPGTDPALMVTCGMVVICVGVTKTPLGSTLVVAGTTGFALAPMLLIAAIVVFMLTRPLSHFRAQRPRDLVPAVTNGRDSSKADRADMGELEDGGRTD